MSHKAPSAGRKVTTEGNNAPIIQEGPGAVEPGSLAAESQAFRDRNSVDPDAQQNRQPHEGASTTPGAPGTSKKHSQGSGVSDSGTGARTAGTAPSYVENQFYRDPSGPHGKNIKEDNSIRGNNASFSAEIGSKNDPSLLAEQKMNMQNSSTPGSTSGRGKTDDGKTTYDVLGTETEA